MINKSILLILPAKDFNEEEFLTVKNTFEKKDLKIFIASGNGLCTGKSGLKVKADISFFNIHESNFAAIVFIGGQGVKDYWNNSILHKTSQKFFNSKKPVAAICSAPVILAKAGLLKGMASTCFADDKKELERAGAEYKDMPVVVRKKIVTAQNAQASLEFSEAIISLL
ncbi:MAG: DJ-1/PfpI family protein [Syntrophomonadaceae bacterium]